MGTKNGAHSVAKLLNHPASDFLLQRGDDVGDGAWAEVALAAMAHADGTGLGFLGTDDEHVGNFLHLRVADLCGQFFVAVVEVNANAVVLQRFVNMLRVVRHFFADRADFHLRRRKPQRKRAGVVLDQNSEKPLD